MTPARHYCGLSHVFESVILLILNMYKKRSLAKQLMTNTEQTDLLIVPRLHLQAGLSGQFELEHLYSLAGVFNIAGTLANYRHRRELEAVFDAAQQIVAVLIRDVRSPTDDEAKVVIEGFNAADRYIRKQRKPDLARAIAYVDRRIAKGDALRPQD